MFRKKLGGVFFDLYQFFGRWNFPTLVLNWFSGLAQWVWGEGSIVYLVHHCWRCSDYDTCKVRKGDYSELADLWDGVDKEGGK